MRTSLSIDLSVRPVAIFFSDSEKNLTWRAVLLHGNGVRRSISSKGNWIPRTKEREGKTGKGMAQCHLLDQRYRPQRECKRRKGGQSPKRIRFAKLKNNDTEEGNDVEGN